MRTWVCGLSDLEKLSPAEALKVVTGRINEMQDSAAGAASKSLVLGRSYVKMGGFANMTTAEIQALTDSVAESAVVMSTEGVTAVDNFDASWRNIRDGFSSGLTLIGSFLIPLLSQFFDKMKEIAGVIKRDVVPEVKELWRVVGPVLIPVLKSLCERHHREHQEVSRLPRWGTEDSVWCLDRRLQQGMGRGQTGCPWRDAGHGHDLQRDHRPHSRSR